MNTVYRIVNLVGLPGGGQEWAAPPGEADKGVAALLSAGDEG